MEAQPTECERDVVSTAQGVGRAFPDRKHKSDGDPAKRMLCGERTVIHYARAASLPRPTMCHRRCPRKLLDYAIVWSGTQISQLIQATCPLTVPCVRQAKDFVSHRLTERKRGAVSTAQDAGRAVPDRSLLNRGPRETCLVGLQNRERRNFQKQKTPRAILNRVSLAVLLY